VSFLVNRDNSLENNKKGFKKDIFDLLKSNK